METQEKPEVTRKRRSTSIYTIRTTIGQEKSVAELIANRVEIHDLTIQSILVPETLRGYIFIETSKRDAIDEAISGISHVRGSVGKTNINELSHFLIPKPVVEGLTEGDIVEVTGGPFKGTRAKVTRVDKVKEEVTVELLDSPAPIPIRVHGDYVRKVGDRIEKDEFSIH
ncbi:MAG: transcription elongation factor Spt5 [Promethearchaeota archaeon]